MEQLFSAIHRNLLPHIRSLTTKVRLKDSKQRQKRLISRPRPLPHLCGLFSRTLTRFFALVVTLYPPNSVSTDDFKSDPSSEGYSTKFSHVSAPTRPPNRPLRTHTEAMHRMGRPVMSKPNPWRLQAKKICNTQLRELVTFSSKPFLQYSFDFLDWRWF